MWLLSAALVLAGQAAVAQTPAQCDNQTSLGPDVQMRMTQLKGRGTQPEPPYCDAAPLATPQFEFITIENGKVNTRKINVNRAHFHEKISGTRRFIAISQ